MLFEWDTYLSSFMAAVTDKWTAKSNIIRMTKSLNYQGFVAGFWNGLCGEVDKSKPPVVSHDIVPLLHVCHMTTWTVLSHFATDC